MTLKLKGVLGILKMYLHTEDDAASLRHPKQIKTNTKIYMNVKYQSHNVKNSELLRAVRVTDIPIKPSNFRPAIFMSQATAFLLELSNTLVMRCSKQLTGVADWVFATLGPLRCD